MSNEKIVSDIQDFIRSQKEKNIEIHFYQESKNFIETFQNRNIGVKLGVYKEVILQEETGLELGGMNKKSFLLIYPIDETNLINDGKITIIGPEIKSIHELDIHFGVLLLINAKSSSNEQIKSLSSFTFISDSIEGFSIRSIPRRFWSRISRNVLKKEFSFHFLANAILYLYRMQFNDIIKGMEILIISSHLDSVDKFLSVSKDLINNLKEKWLKKLDNWKKRIDCDYDWGCEICPYQVECFEIKKVLIARNKRDEY
jgi:CO dehydrogenase/acetyl-CoA synthase beta subunit